MDDLTDDEFSILLIAARGESVMPIGRWEKPVESLVAKGFLKQHDRHNNTITPAGRVALEKRENVDAVAWIEATSGSHSATANIRAVAEGMATTLANIAKESKKVTGGATADAARKWSEVILNRALELLGERR